MERENVSCYKKDLSFPQASGGNLPLLVLLLKEEKQPCLIKQAEDSRTLRVAKYSGMTTFFNNNITAFTLIELLVVVLIIGILAAVAVPQYQKAVEKSKAAQAFAMIRTVAAAQEAYHMANGSYATNFDELGVDIPWTGTTRYVDDNASSHVTGVRSNADWSLQIYREASGYGISVGRISGPYSGGGFLYLLDKRNSDSPTHTMLCQERPKTKTDFPFVKNTGDYCEKIMKGISVPGGRWQL